jgi:uncharacterized protein with PQ loop repeat
MTLQSKALHHLHLRKRIHQKKQAYPNKSRFIRSIDHVAYVAGILVPAFTIPQLLEIWIHKEAGGVSLLTWSSYLLFSLFWTVYGIVHREKPIILMYASQALLQIFIVWGILLFR